LAVEGEKLDLEIVDKVEQALKETYKQKQNVLNDFLCRYNP